jgi:hypothetical protein
MMERKIRFIQFAVQPVAVIDDGENLNPIEIKPIVIRASEWARFAASGPSELLAELQHQLDAQTNPPPSD